jgi:3-isopropylmalate/(R)-2-methylmalate dehydratase small subunit
MITGRVWSFGDDINTDLMVPAAVTYASEEEQRRAVFSASRPGWVDLVAAGDVIVGGRNFGMGSSRPAARSLRNLGLSCLLAESLNGLFFRNAVNFGFLAVECPGVHALFEEGQTAQVDIDGWTVRNRETGTSLPITPVPAELLSLMRSGGVFPHLEQLGLIAPKAVSPARPGMR